LATTLNIAADNQDIINVASSENVVQNEWEIARGSKRIEDDESSNTVQEV
jgi:hypothetical protein